MFSYFLITFSLKNYCSKFYFFPIIGFVLLRFFFYQNSVRVKHGKILNLLVIFFFNYLNTDFLFPTPSSMAVDNHYRQHLHLPPLPIPYHHLPLLYSFAIPMRQRSDLIFDTRHDFIMKLDANSLGNYLSTKPSFFFFFGGNEEFFQLRFRCHLL